MTTCRPCARGNHDGHTHEFHFCECEQCPEPEYEPTLWDPEIRTRLLLSLSPEELAVRQAFDPVEGVRRATEYRRQGMSWAEIAERIPGRERSWFRRQVTKVHPELNGSVRWVG